MAEPLTDEQLYRMKNEYLNQYFEEVSPREFYREVFPKGSFEREGHSEDKKGNGILTVIDGAGARNYLVFDELDIIDEMVGREFAVISAVSYCGRNRTAQNARWLYGITVDLDGVGIQNLRDVFFQMKNGIIPQCTYCINSGHGLHLYYLFERPVALYKHMQDKLRDFKYALISCVWNRYTSSYKERSEVQYQGIFQAFRMVGSQSKLGKDYPVKAFLTGERVTMEYLNDFVSGDKKIIEFTYQSKLTLQQAKDLYPEWYEKRIVQGESRGRWHVKRDLYDWWLRKIKDTENGASVGHRYSCLSVLAAYGVKCDIPEDEVLSDAMGLLPFLDSMSDDEHNRFTKRDVMDAMNLYQESYVTFSREEAERVSGIPIPPNKRNGRKQAVHVNYMNNQRAFKVEIGECTNGGRPTQQQAVQEWRRQHPEGRKIDCERDTGLSRHTILKWWNGEECGIKQSQMTQMARFTAYSEALYKKVEEQEQKKTRTEAAKKECMQILLKADEALPDETVNNLIAYVQKDDMAAVLMILTQYPDLGIKSVKILSEEEFQQMKESGAVCFELQRLKSKYEKGAIYENDKADS